MMIQIPVEGGHSGGDLKVRHEHGDTKLDRSQENGQKLYLSASFIDCVHTFSSITEGWSVVLIYFLLHRRRLHHRLSPVARAELPALNVVAVLQRRRRRRRKKEEKRWRNTAPQWQEVQVVFLNTSIGSAVAGAGFLMPFNDRPTQRGKNHYAAMMRGIRGAE